jgi:hypothetical protein
MASPDLLRALDALLKDITHESAKRSPEAEHQRDLGISQDYANRLAERATFRRLLASDQLDATRFRWWFTQPHSRCQYDLDGWRERIDKQMLKEKA